MTDKLDKRTKEYRDRVKNLIEQDDDEQQAHDERVSFRTGMALSNNAKKDVDRERLQEAAEAHLSVSEDAVFTKLEGGKSVVCCFRHSPCAVHRPTGDFTRCMDSHKTGCNNLLKSPSLTVPQNCEECVYKYYRKGKRVG